MDITGIGSILEIGSKILDRFVPDPQQKAAATLELFKAQQAGEFKQLDADLQAMQMQADINKVEASSNSIFVSGGRPAAMWVCSAGLAYQFVLMPVASFIYQLWTGHALPVPAPTLDDSLWQLMTGMLGLAGWRSMDKKNGVASK